MGGTTREQTQPIRQGAQERVSTHGLKKKKSAFTGAQDGGYRIEQETGENFTVHFFFFFFL